MSKTLEPLKVAKRCNRCGYRMWQDEAGKYHCTNPKCVKYKPQPIPEGGEDTTDAE